MPIHNNPNRSWEEHVASVQQNPTSEPRNETFNGPGSLQLDQTNASYNRGEGSAQISTTSSDGPNMEASTAQTNTDDQFIGLDQIHDYFRIDQNNGPIIYADIMTSPPTKRTETTEQRSPFQPSRTLQQTPPHVQSRPLPNVPENPERSIRRPSLFVAKECSKASLDPISFADAIEGTNREKWINAIQSELSAHEVNGTWEITDRPERGTSLSTKWLFKTKTNQDGTIKCFKARLVARGFEHCEGRDYHETFAPVARIESLRVLLAIGAIKRYNLEQFDVSTAFLNGTLDEEIFIEPPHGLELPPSKCLRLIKALYGLKQAPYVLNSLFDSTLIEMGFEPLQLDPCVYHLTGKECLLGMCVDDGLVLSRNEKLGKQIISELNDKFKTNLTTGSSFLGTEIISDRNRIKLTQKQYVISMLERYQLQDAKALSTPMHDASSLLDEEQFKDEVIVDRAIYQSLIGSLLYAATLTRPDILFAVNLLSRFNHKARKRHLTAAHRILRYLKSEPDEGLVYSSSSKVNIDCFADADYGNDPSDRVSVSGGLMFLAGSPVIFFSRKQDCVAQSTCDAELVTANEVAKELMWLRGFLDNLCIEYPKPIIWTDNQSTISLHYASN